MSTIQSTGQSTFVSSSQSVGMPNQYPLTDATPQAFQQGMFQPNPMYPHMPYQSLGQQYSPLIPPVSHVYANPWMPLDGMPCAVPPPNIQSPG